MVLAALTGPGHARPGAEGDAGLAAKAANDFTLALVAEIAADEPGNLFLSPYSVAVAMAMTAEGARGRTAEEMGRLLRLPASLRQTDTSRPWALGPLHAGFEELMGSWTAGKADAAGSAPGGPEAGLRVANALWMETTYAVRPEYRSLLERHYRAACMPLDFKLDPEGAARRINGWVEERTDRRIRDLVSAELLAPREDTFTALVLTNAVWFKGGWRDSFPESATHRADFRTADGRIATVELMTRRVGARYAAFREDGSRFDTPGTIDAGSAAQEAYPDERGFAIVELPYRGERLAMVVIAPNRPDGLPQVEARLARSLEGWLGSLDQRSVDVFLPSFRLEERYDLVDVLQRMGMRAAFAAADFSGMTTTAKGPPRIDAVLHKAYIEVDERGTEAAAATAIALKSLGYASTQVEFTPEFRADRPFLFFIRDRISGAILFAGRLAEPPTD